MSKGPQNMFENLSPESEMEMFWSDLSNLIFLTGIIETWKHRTKITPCSFWTKISLSQKFLLKNENLNVLRTFPECFSFAFTSQNNLFILWCSGIILVFCAFVYSQLPIDIIPDAIPLIGKLDNMLFTTLGVIGLILSITVLVFQYNYLSSITVSFFWNLDIKKLFLNCRLITFFTDQF